MKVKGSFVILLDGVLTYYSDYDSIPESFDNLVKCEFKYPEGPHSEEEHAQMEKYNDLLQDLMRRETK
jgi:hypothetical protein